MKGKVTGFPTAVPKAEASRFPRTAQASATATMKWNPKSGVNEASAPQAKPSAIRCGLSGRRRMRLPR